MSSNRTAAAIVGAMTTVVPVVPVSIVTWPFVVGPAELPFTVTKSRATCH